MSSASLAHARHTQHHPNHPDATRITALSAAIALNLAVLLIATRPMSAPSLPTPEQPAPVPQIRLITPPAVVPPPPAIVMKPLPHPPKTVAHIQPKVPPVVAQPFVPTVEGRVAPPPAIQTITPSTATPGNSAPANPVEASLAYRSSPLQFPAQAMRQQLHGTVLLRVLVDETGKPIDVLVEHTSGYALLDRSAREQVLASWKFQPAMVDGKAVRAWARVPVSFDLHQQ